MALQGSYDFKGITLSEAYLQVASITTTFGGASSSELKTEAVYNPDGSIKTEPVYEVTWTKTSNTFCSVKVFKDKASKDANINENQLDTFQINFEASLADSAKNHVKQAYLALKAEDKYKDYTDVQ